MEVPSIIIPIFDSGNFYNSYTIERAGYLMSRRLDLMWMILKSFLIRLAR